MELLDGLDTDTLVRRFGPMPAERVVHILRQMCHSLSEAESRGLVHRDIKPANIFLCRYGEDHDFVKVLDFGIAKVVHEAPPDVDPANTIPNVIQGTPAFIAPEQPPQAVGHELHARYRPRPATGMAFEQGQVAAARLASLRDHLGQRCNIAEA